MPDPGTVAAAEHEAQSYFGETDSSVFASHMLLKQILIRLELIHTTLREIQDGNHNMDGNDP